MKQVVKSKIRERLAKGELVKVFVAGHLASPLLVDMIALHGGYDAIWLDQEHAGISLEAAGNCAARRAPPEWTASCASPPPITAR